jgi:hypothetical protein
MKMNDWKPYPENIPPNSIKDYLVTVKRSGDIFTTVAAWSRRLGVENNIIVAPYTWAIFGKVIAFKDLPEPFENENTPDG